MRFLFQTEKDVTDRANKAPREVSRIYKLRWNM